MFQQAAAEVNPTRSVNTDLGMHEPKPRDACGGLAVEAATQRFAVVLP